MTKDQRELLANFRDSLQRLMGDEALAEKLSELLDEEANFHACPPITLLFRVVTDLYADNPEIRNNTGAEVGS